MGFDNTLSEYEIMKNLGYMRIWDCGTRTWVLNGGQQNRNNCKNKGIYELQTI